MPKKVDKLELIENEEISGFDNVVFEGDSNKEEEYDGKKEQGSAGVVSPETPVPASKLETKTKAYVYISHFLSAWGDRMWSFGVGLFLINFSPNSLRLTATYGFSTGGVSLLFGALIGSWVDATPRLKAAQIALVLQNILVALCAGVICVVHWYGDQISVEWPDRGLLQLCHAIIIIIAVLSNLASTARKISVERDWIVEICARDKDLLASMSAFMRFIDLFSAILAPALTGLIIAYTELGFGAVLIAGWNLVSVFAEYYLIWKVYNSVPALKVKMNKTKKDDKKSKSAEAEEEAEELEIEAQQKSLTQQADPKLSDSPGQSDTSIHEAEIKTENKNIKEEIVTISTEESKEKNKVKKKEKNGCEWLCGKLFFSLVTLYKGWRTFMKYEVAYAGLGLAFLYMTVLGFDNITVGYAFSQGLTSDILGGLQAAGAIVGILGTYLYPKVRHCIGTERTGLVSLGLEILCLCLCVASVWAPGSPFDLGYYWRDDPEEVSSNYGSNSSHSDLHLNLSIVTTVPAFGNSTDLPYNVTTGVSVEDVTKVMNGPDSPISIWLLMIGIITARCGLWMADLTITQLFLERVVEDERGIVGGVQSSLNKLMDMLKFILVIIVPEPPQFGILVIISFAFICMAWMLYAKFSRSARGHLFHFEKVGTCCDKQNNNVFKETDIEKEGTSDRNEGNSEEKGGTTKEIELEVKSDEIQQASVEKGGASDEKEEESDDKEVMDAQKNERDPENGRNVETYQNESVA